MKPKKIFTTSFVLLAFGIFFSCSGDDDSGTPPVGNETQLVLTASATETTTGEEIVFEVTVGGEAVSDATILVDGTAISGYSHVFETSGEYQVMAKKEGYKDSEAVEVLVKEELTRVKSYTANGQVTTFSYNADNYLSSYNYGGSDIRNVIYDAENKVIRNWIFEYTYNNLGQVTAMTEDDGSSAINKQATFIYNNEGLVARSYNQFSYASTGETTHFTREFEYDTDGRLVSFTEKESGQSTYRFLISYDGNGNIVQIKWQSSYDGSPYSDLYTYSWTYDDKKNPRYALLNRMGVSDHTSLVYAMEMGGDSHQFLGNYVYLRMNYYNPNNMLTFSYSSSSGSFSNTYEYVYNEEGYPTSVEETRNLSDGSIDMRYYSWEYETFVK